MGHKARLLTSWLSLCDGLVLRQTQAVERVVSLLPASLVKGDEKGGAVAVMSVLTSTEEDRRRKDERQAQVTRR